MLFITKLTPFRKTYNNFLRQFTIYICISCQKKREFDNIIDNVPCVVVLQEEKKKGFVSDDSRKLSSNINIFRPNNP